MTSTPTVPEVSMEDRYFPLVLLQTLTECPQLRTLGIKLQVPGDDTGGRPCGPPYPRQTSVPLSDADGLFCDGLLCVVVRLARQLRRQTVSSTTTLVCLRDSRRHHQVLETSVHSRICKVGTIEVRAGRGATISNETSSV